MARVVMRRSRRVSAYRRGLRSSKRRGNYARNRSFSARSASCFPEISHADPRELSKRLEAAMPMVCTQLGVPPTLALAATYTREARVGIDRIWENVLDW